MTVLSIGQMWADKITAVANIESGKTYYIGATKSNSTDYYLSIADHGTAAASGKTGSAVTSKSDADVFTFTQSGDNWTIQFASGKYLSLKNAKANGKVDVVDAAASWTISDDNSLLLLAINGYYLKCNSQTNTTNFGSYASGQLNVWLEEASATPAVLQSITVSGTPTKTEYYAGQNFDPAGLTVTGTYDQGDPQIITSNITWSYNPSQTLALNQTSIGVIATVGEIVSPEFTVNDLSVTAAPVVVSSIEDIEDGASYYIQGVRSSGSVIEYLKFTDGTAGATIAGGSASTTDEAIAITFNKVSDGVYQLVTPEGLYVQPGASNGKIALSTSATTCNLANTTKTWDNSAAIAISTVDGSSNTWIIQKNTSGTNFGGYKNSGYDVTLVFAGAAAAVNKPTISGDENFVTSTSVSLSCTTTGATIYYTTNGSDPKESGTVYSGPFSLTASAHVQAIAKLGSDWSSYADKQFTKISPITVAAAIAAIPNADDVKDDQYVSGIVCTAGTSVSSGKMTYYISDDGSETSRLQIYKGKNLNNTNFTAVSDLAIGDRVVVFGQLKNYNGTPEMNDGNYLVSKAAPAVAAPTFSPDGGGFMGETDVTISCATASSAIYYTLNGSTPSKSSTLYEGAIHLNATTTIKAIAYVGDDASLVISKTFTLTAPMTVAEALTALDSENPINNAAVSGIISTAPTSNPSSGRLTYKISDDGEATNELEVFNGYGLNGASFSDKTDLQEGDAVTVFGNLIIYNSTTKEFSSGSRLIAFSRPVKPSITADPEAVTNVAAAGVANQTIALTYENIENYSASVALYADATAETAFSGSWLTASISANYATVTYSVSANDGEARTAYIKVHATGDDSKEATKIIAVSQLAYVAPALPAELPFAFDGGKADIANTQGMSQDGLDNSDYASSPKLKFKAEGAWVIIEIASAPGKLTYDILGNSFSGGTFKVQQSADGVDYTDVATYTKLGAKASEEKTLLQATRFVKFIYTTKDQGNVALGNIAIAAPVAVETPTFSPAGGEYAGAQSVTISCETGGATIYYTSNGDDPDNTKTLYEGAINVDATMTIKAIAYKEAEHSEIATATYTITPALTDYYEKVSSGDVAEGTYLIVYEAGNVALNGGLGYDTDHKIDVANNTIDVTIVGNKIGVTSATEAATVYIDPTAGSIQAACGKYIGVTGHSNGLSSSDNAIEHKTLSVDADGNAEIVVGTTGGDMTLLYNSANNQARFRYYTSTSQQAIQLYKLANEVVKPASGLAWDPAGDIEITVGGAFTAPTLLNPNNIPAGDISIASSNTDLATVTNGEVALVENATGSATITATYTGETYKPITVSYKIKVNPASSIYVSPSLNVNFGSVAKDAALPADKTISVTLNNVVLATAVLGGTNPDAFSIDPATLTESGNITISVVSSATVANYSATLTISDEAGNAESKVVNLSFSVTEPAGEETPVSTTSKWVPATAIEDGMQVLITGVKADVTYAMGAASSNSNNRTSVAGSLDEGVFTPGENTMPFTLVATGVANTYYIKTSNNQYLYNASTSGNSYLKTKAENMQASWTITLDGDGNAVITSVENTNRTLMRLNPNGQNNPLFNCYASNQNDIKLYVPQSVTPEPADYTEVRSGLAAGNYYTICNPKKMTAIKGATLWSFIGSDANFAYIVQEDAPFVAGRPYIMYATAAKVEAVLEGEDAEIGSYNGLHGTSVAMNQAALDAAGTGIYLVIGNSLCHVDGGTGNSLPAYRAYVVRSEVEALDDAPDPKFVPAHKVRKFALPNNTPTDISNIGTTDQPTKMMIDGQLFILRDGKMFDATGRLVK